MIRILGHRDVLSLQGVVARFLLLVAVGVSVPARAAALEPPGPQESTALRVVVDLVVEDLRGRPVNDLLVEELDVVQDATKQPVKTITRLPEPGRYTLSYLPLSGKPGGVTISTTRRGLRLRGPDGPSLKPRLIWPVPPLEAELLNVLEARGDRNDLDCTVGVMRFQSRAEGVVHVFAVDLSLFQLRDELAAGAPLRIQILARVRSEDGQFTRRLTLDRDVDPNSGFRLVWTTGLPLPAGRYAADIVVRDPANDRVSVRHLAFDAPPAATGLHLSSLVFVDPTTLVLPTEGKDDPFFQPGRSVMPALRVVLPAGAEAFAQFFAMVFPAPDDPAPVTLSVEILRDGLSIGEVPLALPPREPTGEFHLFGTVPTKTFLARPYVLRLIARQGQATVREEAVFTITDGSVAPGREQAPVRFPPERSVH